MKKIAFSYKGIFGMKRINNTGLNEKLIEDAKENLLDHKSKFHDQIRKLGYDIDFYFSTYDLNEDLNALNRKILHPKIYSFLPNNYINTYSCWQCQFIHYKNLISHIKNQNVSYDFFVFTRPDLKFHQDFETFSKNVDFNKFNIPVKHLSGNCDDNLFIFPSKFLNQFENCMDILSSRNGITHEINHILTNQSIPINWMSEFVHEDPVYGQKIFEFFR